MSTLAKSLQNPMFCNWVKAALALDFTKEAVLDFVIEVNEKSHIGTVRGIPSVCSWCDFKWVDTCMSNPCKNKALRIAIHSLYIKRYRNVSPTFENTTPDKCFRQPWEFAKCFMPGKGGAYKECKSADDTDVAGILSVMANNLDFQQYLPPGILSQDDNIVRKVIGIRNKIMHNSSFEIDDQTFNDYITDIDTLLSQLPVRTKPGKPYAIQGRAKIRELSTGNLTIGSTADITRCINEAVNSLKSKHQELLVSIYIMEQKQSQYIQEIKDANETGVEEMKVTITNGTIAVERKAKEALQHIGDNSEQYMQQIVDTGDKIIQDGIEIGARIERQTTKSMNALKKKIEDKTNELSKQLLEGREQIEKYTENSKARLNNEIKEIMQGEDIKSEIESKTGQITEITKQSVGELEKIARACMEGIQEQASSLTERAISSHLVEADHLVKRTTEATANGIERLQKATQECLTTIQKQAQSLTVNTNNFRADNENLSVRLLAMETKFAEVRSEMFTKYKKKLYPFEHLDVKCGTEGTCFITDMVKVDAYRLAVVDNCNNRVKIIDVHKNEITSSVQVEDPWAITRVDEHKLIVSCKGMLQFLEHKDGKLTVEAKQIVMAGDTKGINFAGGKLAFIESGQGEQAVRIIDMDGNILNTIQVDKSIASLQAVIFGQDKLYVTCLNGTVRCFDRSGSLEYTLTHNDVKGPYGLTIDAKGNLYISECIANTIYVIRVNNRTPQITKFLVEKDGITMPKALTYCDMENKLYVSHAELELVSVHKGLKPRSQVDGDESY